MKTIAVVGGARDYHAMDWYRTIRDLLPEREVVFLTDLIGGEGVRVIVNDSDRLHRLLIIDHLLMRHQSFWGHLWRNIVKLLVIPFQIVKLRKYSRLHPETIYHAHPMYYMMLCWLSGLDFIGTPQGSELLVRAKRNPVYCVFARKILSAATNVTVDSESMKDAVRALASREALLIQNGIDAQEVLKFSKQEKINVVSIRGMSGLYRIREIVEARNSYDKNIPIHYAYPFFDSEYYDNVKLQMQSADVDHGRLDKLSLYELLGASVLVISVPKSDSSPRSVYEAVFAGCCVAVTANAWIDKLPGCMKDRLFIVDLQNPCWFEQALCCATKVVEKPFVPSEEALNAFDQIRTMKLAAQMLY